MLDFGDYRLIQVEIQNLLLRFFFPHTRGLVNKMLRLQRTGGLWRRLWELKCTELYRIYAFLMSVGELTHSSF